MRPSMFVMLAFAIVLGVWSRMPLAVQGLSTHVVASVSAAQDQPAGTAAQDKPSGKLDIDININKGNGNAGRWYANPMWIAIGALAVIVVLALIVMIGRGGGTTVVKG